MLRVMLRPRWLLALLLALAIAAGFAWLGQWQLERAVTSGAVVERVTEHPVPLTTLVQPNTSTTQSIHGQLVTVTGSFAQEDYGILTDRYNGGEPGFWVIGHLVTESAGSPGLAVALGWTADRADAETVAAELSRRPQEGAPQTLTGRYLATEAPVAPAAGADPRSMTTMSMAALINVWHDFDDTDVYGGYLVAAQPVASPAASLDAIDSPAPEAAVDINWLNIFYAAEWAIFAGFAVFFWYRLVKDTLEREQELAAVGIMDGNGH